MSIISRLAIAVVLLLTSDMALSQISRQDWVALCKNADGELKKTFDAIRQTRFLGKIGCNLAYYKAINLKKLDLKEKDISDLSPFAGLPNLKELRLNDNQISDLSPLEFTDLEILTLAHNQVSDLSPLANLTELRILVLSDNQVSNLSPLARLTRLKSLCLNDNAIYDLSPLSGLTHLDLLMIARNQISSISPLRGLRNNVFLMLEDNYIRDYSPVQSVELVIGRGQTSTREPNQRREPTPRQAQDFLLIESSPAQEDISADNNCPICLTDYEEEDVIAEVPVCEHKFHKECLASWLREHNNCPCCRAIIPQE